MKLWLWAGEHARMMIVPLGIALAAVGTVITEYTPMAEWITVGLFSLLLFFIRGWMMQREKADDEIKARLDVQTQEMGAIANRLSQLPCQHESHLCRLKE